MKVNIGNFPGPRSKKQRRVDVKIDPWDTWSADHTLAHIIAPMLIQLRDTTHGFPSEMYDILGIPFSSISSEDCQRGADLWTELLNKMIWSFTEIATDNYDDKYLLREDGTSDFDGYRAHEEKIQEGLTLFGTYYRALWD